MATFSIESSRIVDAPLDVVWSVVSDAGGYHAVVDTLEHTEIIAGRGQGMVRHCVDTKGREWNESCTLWEDDRAFRMTVDIDTYPPSLRAVFRRVEGTWSVAPADTGTVITMRFDGETKLGPLGKAVVSAMGRGAVLDGIMDGYEAQIRERLARDQAGSPR